jgi:hypothetical protein
VLHWGGSSLTSLVQTDRVLAGTVVLLGELEGRLRLCGGETRSQSHCHFNRISHAARRLLTRLEVGQLVLVVKEEVLDPLLVDLSDNYFPCQRCLFSEEQLLSSGSHLDLHLVLLLEVLRSESHNSIGRCRRCNEGTESGPLTCSSRSLFLSSAFLSSRIFFSTIQK